MLIGILQCGHFPVAPNATNPPTYSTLYADLLDGHGFSFRTWSVVDMEFPGSVQDADGWLISGSKHGAYEDHPFIAPLKALIGDIYASDVPLVGICFGHQIIAQALGGRVEKHSGGWNCGQTVYDVEGAAKTLTAWHQDQVIDVPPEATVIGQSKACAHAFLRYRGNAFTMQPHPEFDDDATRIVLQGPSSKLLSSDMLNDIREGLGTPLDNAAIAADIAGFFKDRRQAGN